MNQDETSASRQLPPRPSNTVVINHGNGWRTHYGHMRQGSVIVKEGQDVDQGALLGLVGLSGSTNFPHLHFFLSYKGQNIDPFTGMTGTEGCEQAAKGRSYWSAEANAKLGYKKSGVFSTGFSDHSPTFEELKTEYVDIKTYKPGTDEIFYWLKLWGVKKGDQEELQIYKPDGTVFKRSSTVETSLVESLRSFRHASSLPFPPGIYRVSYQLRRYYKNSPTEVLINVDNTMEILPLKEKPTTPEN